MECGKCESHGWDVGMLKDLTIIKLKCMSCGGIVEVIDGRPSVETLGALRDGTTKQ